MRRKLIKQGKSGLTIYLPKKWIDENNLENGNEVELEEKDNTILIYNFSKKKEGKIIQMNLNNLKEDIIQMKIVNAYIEGYDKIIIKCKGNEFIFREITKKYLIGMEFFNEKETYIIESVAEPNYDNYHKIVNKLFFILTDIPKV